MTVNYIVNIEPQENGGYTVHTDWCDRLPPLENQLFLGHFVDCWGAIERAKALDIEAAACHYCCKETHIG